MAFENTIQERGVTALWAESYQLRYKFTKEQEEELKGYRKERERLIGLGFAQASIKAKRLEKDKIFFITDFDTYTSEENQNNVTHEEVGGATSWNTGFGMLCKAALYPSKYKVCIHEFAHFLHVPDATKQQKMHPDEIYFLKSEENYDNIMYYKDYFHVKKVIDKRWFFYQMKRAYNDWNTYCGEGEKNKK